MGPIKKPTGVIVTKHGPVFKNENEENQKAVPAAIYDLAGVIKSADDEEYIAHLAAIVNCSVDAIISKSLEGIIKSWNKGAEKMFGYTAGEVLGKHISLIIPASHIDDEKMIVKRICNGEILDHYETTRINKSGKEFCVSLTVSSLKDRFGKIIGVSKIARDISSQKQSEMELIRVNKELVFQNIEKEKRATELIIANKELAFQNNEKENRAAELIIANEELIFQNIEKEKRAAELIIANKELAFQNDEKEKRAAELVVANRELAFQNSEKESRDAELMVANKELVFQNEEKEKRAAELIIANNDLKISEDQVREVNNELESFSYSVSHDLRAPLRAIHGYAKMLERNFETQLNPEALRLMNNIINNAKKMGMLIDDLLNFSRTGRKELVKMNIGMQHMVTTICNELKSEQVDRNIEFHIKDLLPAMADNIGIKQVWLNLISNAIKYSRLKETAVIEIGCEQKADEIIYYVKDNGAGYDMRYADKLFGVFQRLHTDEEFEGTGVGLALVQRIISKHGGRVWGEGIVNKGAIFYFSLHKT